MNSIVNKIYDGIKDLSDIAISTHAMFQYNTKCSPSLDIIDVIKTMKKKLGNVQEVELKNKEKNKHTFSNYYIDEDKNIYVVANNKVVTTYPSERIFMAKPVYSNRKTGQGWK